MTNSRTKNAIFWVLACGMVVLAVELVSYVILAQTIPNRIRGRVGRGSAEFHVEQRQKTMAAYTRPVVAWTSPANAGHSDEYSGAMMFHPALGWDYPSNVVFVGPDHTTYSHGADGQRNAPESYPRTAIATYGDSFTHCDEVADEETWQTFLGEKLKANVLNFGVGGYGTDQAFLKFHLHGSPKAKVVMLCILPENINRVVNIYRPFYNYEDPLALTKPRFLRDRTGFKLAPNPLADARNLMRLDDPDFLAELGKNDYWFKFDKNIRGMGFPYLLSAFRWRSEVADTLSLSLSGRLHAPITPRYCFNLYDEPEALGIMRHIVDLFVSTARERGATPVIAIMAHKDYVTELMENRVSRIEPLLKHIRQNNYAHIDLIEAMAKMQPTRSQLDRWFTGHASPEGNRVTSDILYDYFNNTGMIAAAN